MLQPPSEMRDDSAKPVNCHSAFLPPPANVFAAPVGSGVVLYVRFWLYVVCIEKKVL